MTKTETDNGIDYESLGLGQVQEADRMQLDERGPIQITRIRFDYKTKYWNEKTKTGSPITKFDGFDVPTGERVKYFTLSQVIYKNFSDILTAVGSTVQKDESGNEWYILKKPINIKGFEKISTGVRGQNPYIKIKTN